MGWKNVLFLGLVGSCFSLAACGGGSGTSSSSGSTTTSGGSNNTNNGQPGTAAVLAQNYKGTYRTNIITTSPSFLLTLTQNGSAFSGTFTSIKIAGQAVGTVSGSNITFTVTEPGNGGQVTFTGTVSGSTMTIGSITGLDTFGNNTSGTGSCTALATPPISNFTTAYNGIAYLGNNSNFIGAQSVGVTPFAPTSGNYPVSVTGFAPDGSGNYAGSFTSGFLSGIFTMNWFSNGGYYYFQLYPQNALSWFGGQNQSPSDSSIALSPPGTTGSYVTSTLNLHPGSISSDLAGTYTFTGTAIPGVKNLQMVITSTDGIHFSAQITGAVQEASGAQVDTVSGALQGVYDLQPHADPAIYNSGYAIKFAAAGGAPLTIGNNSGLTPSFTVYLSYVDTATGTINVDVDAGDSTNSFVSSTGIFKNLTLTKQ
jgi:hypothetical protein